MLQCALEDNILVARKLKMEEIEIDDGPIYSKLHKVPPPPFSSFLLNLLTVDLVLHLPVLPM